MKIALCKGELRGADEILVRFATALKASGHDVTVIFVLPHASAAHASPLARAGVRIETFEDGPGGADLQRLRRIAVRTASLAPFLRRLIVRRGVDAASSAASRYVERRAHYFETARPDVVYVNSPDPAAIVLIELARAAGRAIIYHEVLEPFGRAESQDDYGRFAESAIPRCDVVAALSPSLARLCHDRLPGSPSTVVLPLMIEPAETRARSRDGRDGTVFGFASRFDEQDGALILLEAFTLVKQTMPLSRLRIMTPRAARTNLVAGAESLGIADWCSFELGSQTAEFLRGIDTFVVPSHVEGIPASMIEAMAHGIPVVATSGGGIDDVISNECGRVVQRGDIRALAEAMIDVASDDGRRIVLGTAARKQYETLFSPAAVRPWLIELFENVATGRTAPASSAHPWASRGVPHHTNDRRALDN